MPDTFIKIASVTVGAGGASTMSFTSIPSTYTDLCLKISARSSRSAAGDDFFMTLNGSSSSFTYKQLYGFSGGAGSASGTSGYVGNIPASSATASTFGSQELYFPNYASSANKSISIDSALENNSSTDWQLDLFAELWSNTSAITSISLTPGIDNFVQYSTATLYGIKNS